MKNPNPQSQESKNSCPDLELLGQKFNYPNNKIKLFAFCFLIFCASTILLYWAYKGKNVTINENGIVVTGIVKDNQNLKTKGFILSFWTPSEKTKQCFIEIYGIDRIEKGKNKDSLWILNKGFDNSKYGWQVNPVEGKNFQEANKKFGKVVKCFANGYRRTKVIGEGESKLKEGWWWSFSVSEEFNNHFIQRFKKAYINFWCPDAKWNDLYIEVVGNSSKD